MKTLAVFLENDKYILLLQKKDHITNTWKIPEWDIKTGEVASAVLQRKVKKELGLDLNPSSISSQSTATYPQDLNIHIYHVSLVQRPDIQTPLKKYTDYEWVSIYAFKSMPLSKEHNALFDTVYSTKIWQRVDPNWEMYGGMETTACFALKKGSKVLNFNASRRFVLNLIGTTGSGKGTQGGLLSKLYGIPHISPGELFRQEFRNGSALARMLKQYYEKRYPALFPEEISLGMMTKRLAQNDCQGGFILDGFPKTQTQAQVAYTIFLRAQDFHVPLFMDVPEQDIWDRFPGRFICNNCGHEVQNFDENLWPGFCPIDAKSGTMIPLIKRAEDENADAIQRKLNLFRENIASILESTERRDPICKFSLNNLIPPREVLHLLSQAIQDKLDLLSESEANNA